MKQRLDLDGLLRKYEKGYLTNESSRGNPYSPYSSPRTVNPKSKPIKIKTQMNYNRENDVVYYHTQVNQAISTNYRGQKNKGKVSQHHFQMSKQECEKLLLNVKEELKQEENNLHQSIEISIQQVKNRFYEQHQHVKKELFNILNQALDENEKMVNQMIAAYSQTSSKEYSSVYKKIAQIQNDITKMLNKLNSNEYKQCIADIVTKDFSAILNNLKNEVNQAQTIYRQSLSKVEVDKLKIDLIKQGLNKLYYWKQKQKPGFTENFEQIKSKKVFQSNRRNNIFSNLDDGSAPKRMRKSFFNFEQNF